MTWSGTIRLLLRRWYLVTAGILMSLVLCAVTFSLVPPQYTSSGSAMLVRSKGAAANTANPLLNFDNSLTTTAQMVTETLRSPTVPAELGLAKGRDSFTVKNGSDLDGGSQQPFIYVTSLSTSPSTSAEIVSAVLDRANRVLTDQQSAMRVTRPYDIRMVDMMSATPPLYAPGASVAIAGVALMLGLVLTVIAACAYDRVLAAYRAARAAAPEPAVEDGPADPPERARDDARTPAGGHPGPIFAAARHPESRTNGTTPAVGQAVS
jgi:capsular polysaccharide biosynthesis protein